MRVSQGFCHPERCRRLSALLRGKGTRDEEARSMRGFDAIIAIQAEEAAEIRAMCPDQTVITLGTSSPPPPERDIEEHENTLLYVGGANGANIDGMRHFLERCWPRIRKACPRAELRVCGYIYQAFLSESHDGVEFLGHVDDIELEYAQAALVVNPIWVGTGLKIKTIEALARGKALVTTGKGIEGMQGDPSVACAITKTDDEFVSRSSSPSDFSPTLRKYDFGGRACPSTSPIWS